MWKRIGAIAVLGVVLLVGGGCEPDGVKVTVRQEGGKLIFDIPDDERRGREVYLGDFVVGRRAEGTFWEIAGNPGAGRGTGGEWPLEYGKNVSYGRVVNVQKRLVPGEYYIRGYIFLIEHIGGREVSDARWLFGEFRLNEKLILVDD
ncbi:MAG: hypothetical protein ABT940_12390 [Alphaproteobacteria bacterium]